MRNYLLLAGIFLLTGCVVADMDSTNYTTFPYVQTFQKMDSVGHTYVSQRKKDLYDCGVDKKHSLNSNDESWRRNEYLEGETTEQFRARVTKVESCMKEKGYVILGFNECGPLKAPTGKCN